MNRKKIKQINLFQSALILTIIVLLNVISIYTFHRFDLTSEYRYTLTPATKTILNNLDDIVYVKVYLEGDLPVGFKRLKNAVKELLDEFRNNTNSNIEYEFINPSEITDKKTRNEKSKDTLNFRAIKHFSL